MRPRVPPADDWGMRPLIGVTTSEMRRGDLATLRRHGEPPHPEMALGITYLQAIERAGGLPVVLPPLPPESVGAAARAPRRRLPVGRPGPRSRRLRRPRAATPSWARPSRRSTRSSSSSSAWPTSAACPILGVCRGAQTLNVARGGTLHQHVANHRQAQLATVPTHAVTIALHSQARPHRRLHAARGELLPSPGRRRARAPAWPSPPAPTTARSRRSRTARARSSSACSGTPRRSSTSRPTARCSARSCARPARAETRQLRAA